MIQPATGGREEVKYRGAERDCGKRAYLTTPALATEANGTSFDKTSFVVGDTRRRGTRRVSDTASKTEVSVAAVYASCQLPSQTWLTCSNFRRCHFDRFIRVTEIHLYISLLVMNVDH
jgi:hypothetical protein